MLALVAIAALAVGAGAATRGWRPRRWAKLVSLLSAAPFALASSGSPAEPVHPAGALQALVDGAKEGAVLVPPPGRYPGPLVVSKPLTLDGRGHVTVDGQGHGTVVRVTAARVRLVGLRVTGSGESHDQLDAAIRAEADDVEISFSTLDDVLFGVALQAANGALVCGNRIRSKSDEPSLRGDAVRIWYGRHNRVHGNDIDGARDVSLANAPENVVEKNRIRRGRIGAQVVFSPRARLEENLFDANVTGVAVLYSNEVEVRNNRVLHSRGLAGSALTFKESSHCVAQGNEVVDCSVAVKVNAPTSPDNVIDFVGNRFAHNVAGMDFYGENGGHRIHGNAFEHNLRQVTVSGPMSARGNDWSGNYFDDYQGFDRDGDGVGDQPYELYAFADRIWMETPAATFFRNSPVMELIDFLERLAPFASPELTLRDPSPAMAPPRAQLPSAAGFTPSCP